MKKFVTGLVMGLTLGATVTASAATGYMMGWTVSINGHEICSDPFVWSNLREIECD